MTIHVNSTSSHCPVCSMPAQGQTITESCRLLPTGVTALTELLFKNLRPISSLARIFKGVSAEDPCQSCPHNELIENTGTFIAMKQIGEHEWGELHLCRVAKLPILFQLQMPNNFSLA